MMKYDPMMSQEEKVDYYRQQAREYIAALNARDMDRVLAVFADGATVNDPKWKRSFTGKDELHGFYEAVFTRATLEVAGPIRGSYGNVVATPVIAHLPDSRVEVITLTHFNDEGLVETYDAYWGPTDIIKA